MQTRDDEIASLQKALKHLEEENRRIKAKAHVYFNNSDLSYVVLDAKQCIVEVNTTFEGLFGYTKEAIIGTPFSTLFTTPQLYDTWCANYTHYNTFDTISNLEFRLQKKEGHIFWAELFGRSFEDDGALFSIWSIRDISLRVRSRTTIRNLNIQLQKQFEELQEILDLVPVPIYIKDKQFCYIGCNKAFCAFFGMSKEMIVGKNVFELFSGDMAEVYHAKDEEIPFVPYQNYKVTTTSSLTNKELVIEFYKKRILHEGEFDGVVGVLLDVTEKEHQEQYLQRRVDEEVKRNLEIQIAHQEEMIRNAKFSSIGQMAAGITHEINTPLTYVKGNFEMLLEDIARFVPIRAREGMLSDGRVIQEGLERIESIIATMREVSQKSTEKQEVINVYETVMNVLLLARNRAKQIVTITLNGAPYCMAMPKNAMHVYALIQKQRIEQVWIIILNNALDELIKIDDFNARVLHVNVGVSDDAVEVSFWDNAGGIDAKILPRIFEPFETTKESSGIGIGLNIAHNIVTQNGGEINAKNHLDGALFTVTFPRILPTQHQSLEL